MRMLFVAWLLIVSGVIDARWWPTSVLGEVPACDRLSVRSGAPTCDGTPAWQVFQAALTPPAPPSNEANKEDGEPISNGF